MIIAGVLLILIKYRILRIGFIPAGADEYTIAPPLEEQIETRKAQKNSSENLDTDEDTQ